MGPLGRSNLADLPSAAIEELMKPSGVINNVGIRVVCTEGTIGLQSCIWTKSQYCLWSQEVQKSVMLVIAEMFLTAHHYWAIPTVCRPLLHLCCPRGHHTLSPRNYWSTPLLAPPGLCDLPPASRQYYCRLDQRNTNQYIIYQYHDSLIDSISVPNPNPKPTPARIAFSIACGILEVIYIYTRRMRSGYKTSKDLTGFSTVHLFGASNAVLNTITHKRFWDATCCRIYSPTWAGTLAIFTACEQNKSFSIY